MSTRNRATKRLAPTRNAEQPASVLVGGHHELRMSYSRLCNGWTNRFRIAALTAVLGLVALIVASCGGDGGGDGSGRTVLALTFRLDGGSPALSAYAGDLDKNPLELPPGRYYIEAVSEDDVSVRHGEVDVEPGQVIAVLPVEDTAGGSLADPERAESLRTIANFLIDMELAKFAILESASGEFAEPLFDTTTQPDGADLEELFAMQAAIVAQEEAVIGSILQIERDAQVSLPVSYVHSGTVPQGRLFSDLLDAVLPDFFNRIRKLPERERTRILEITDEIDPIEREEVFDGMPANLRGDAASFDEWLREVEGGEHDNALGAIHGYLYVADIGAVQASGHTPGATMAEEGAPLLEAGVDLALEAYGRVPHVGRAIEVTNKTLEWEEYIKNIYLDPAGGAEKLLRDEYIELLDERIRSDLRELAPHLSDSVIDSLVAQLSNRVVSAVSSPADRRLPPADSTGLDTSWIDELIQDISDQLVAGGESGIAIAVLTDDLPLCLMAAVEDGLDQEEALIYCADFLLESATPTPTERTPTPMPEPTPAQCDLDPDGDGVISQSEAEDWIECGATRHDTPTP